MKKFFAVAVALAALLVGLVALSLSGASSGYEGAAEYLEYGFLEYGVLF